MVEYQVWCEGEIPFFLISDLYLKLTKKGLERLSLRVGALLDCWERNI